MGQKECDRVFDRIIVLMARGRCFKCHRNGTLEAHHVRFRSHTRDPRIRYNPDFGVALDFNCHHCNIDAPHVDNKAFIAWLKEELLTTDPARWARIKPILSKPVPPFRDKIDYRAIMRDLRATEKMLTRTVRVCIPGT